MVGTLSIEMLGPLLLVALVSALLGAVVFMIGHRRKHKPKAPPASAPKDESPRHEAQRYFLMNETGNVLISTSLSPSGQLPEATLAQFSEALAHLSAIFFAVAGSKDATGKPFDPNFHEAVSQQESEEVAEGNVLQQLRKGYKLRERLLRPATVIVAKKAAG